MSKKTLLLRLSTLLLLVVYLSGCSEEKSHRFDAENVIAWCIVPFDAKERTPQQRIDMLKELGISRYAYDWREKHIPEMAEEFELAASNGIEVSAVWLWIDARNDTVGALSASNEKLFDAIRETGIQTDIWMSFNSNYFDSLTQAQALERGIEMVDFLSQKAEGLGCRLALYNHGDWFGNPMNQVQIIQALPKRKLGIIYNFHHLHEDLGAYEQAVTDILPYLWTVNLNGMREEGPKILTIGEGDEERDMIKLLIDKGYEGPWGVLGHIETEDVRVVLERNLKGLRSLQL